MSKEQTQLDNRKGNLLADGWEVMDQTFSPEKTAYTLFENPQPFQYKLEKFIHEFVSSRQNLFGVSLWESLLSLSFDETLRIRWKNVEDFFFTNYMDRNSPKYDPYISFNWDIPGDNATLKISDSIKEFITKKIIAYLGKPKFSTIELSREYNRENLIAWDKDTLCIRNHQQQQGEHLNSFWQDCRFNCFIDSDDFHNSLIVRKDRYEALFLEASKGLRCRIGDGEPKLGKAGLSYPLKSFPSKPQQLTKELTNHLELGQNQTKVLVRGGPGTCKSQWARSYADRILSPLGYFTFIIPPHLLSLEYIPWFLPRVCVICDEFSAKNRESGSDYLKLMTDNFLRLFDDTATEDVIEEKSEGLSQKIVWLFTSNYEKDSSYDPAMLRRVDIDYTFTENSNGNKIDTHLD